MLPSYNLLVLICTFGDISYYKTGFYYGTINHALDAGFKIPGKRRKGKKCELVDFLEEYDDGSNVEK